VRHEPASSSMSSKVGSAADTLLFPPQALIGSIDGALELLAIMDIRARSISFTTRPRRPYGPPDHERAGETFSPSPLSDSQTSAGKPTLAFGSA
jgi:hypothetical protein